MTSTRHRLQFSLKDMFLAIALIAIGLGGIFALKHAGSTELAAGIWLASCASLSAGIGAPFQCKRICVFVGVGFGICVVAALWYLANLLSFAR